MMQQMMKVEGHPDLRRAPSGAIININQTAYEEALLRRQAEKEKQELKQKVKSLEANMVNMEKKLDKILDAIMKDQTNGPE